MVDTFYAIGLVMRVCQSISLLELLHIYIGIESNHLFPRFLQLTERVVILFGVITSQEEIQEKYVVCVLFIFWNLLDMVRYTYSMLSVIGISYAVLTWLSQTLWMPIYPLCVLAEAFTIYQSLPYFESFGANSTMLPLDISTCFPYVLKLYLLVLFIGSRAHVPSISERRYKLYLCCTLTINELLLLSVLFPDNRYHAPGRASTSRTWHKSDARG
ncbi:very-long-chain (3R)-3-hydroxyacyl-CoA dehydratase 4 isoform X4 [Peromyscus maniculatus bairdii]